MKKLSDFTLKKLDLYQKMWLITPFIIWFSYFPNIHFGQNSTMNFEISIPLIFLVLFGLISLLRAIESRLAFWKIPIFWVVSCLFIYSGFSLVWTENLPRAVLTFGITSLLYFVFLGALASMQKIKKILPKVADNLIISAVIVSILAIIQFIAGLWLDQNISLLCNGCVAEQFGFVRPNVFAIEPQFLGSMLLAPLLLIVQKLIVKQDQGLRDYAFFGLIVLALFLTMSRGAIYAFAAAVLFLLIINIRQKYSKKKLILTVTIAITASLLMQGLAAQINPRVSETFMGGLSKSISQMTLGIVNIPVEKESEPVDNADRKVEPAFDGYVEESTNVRVGRTELALKAWSRDISTTFFGAGLGSSGVAMHNSSPELIGAREIVQNEYVERLLEGGIVGLGLFLLVMGSLFWQTQRHKWLWSIIIAFMCQWIFFSGYPNLLHVYLVLTVMAVSTLRPDQLKLAKRY